jgi:hypothetical protein
MCDRTRQFPGRHAGRAGRLEATRWEPRIRDQPTGPTPLQARQPARRTGTEDSYLRADRDEPRREHSQGWSNSTSPAAPIASTTFTGACQSTPSGAARRRDHRLAADRADREIVPTPRPGHWPGISRVRRAAGGANVISSADLRMGYMPTTTTRHVRFRTIGGVRTRYTDSGGPRQPRVLPSSPWPESVYAFAPIWASLAEQARLFAAGRRLRRGAQFGLVSRDERDDLSGERAGSETKG